jgi:DNA-binding transcriptional MerR regulator
MKYLTTLEVAHQLHVSKQTLLNWLYSGKVPEPPRNKRGYRLWSASRVALVKKLIADGRIHRRTIVHREASNRPEVVEEFAREVVQFLGDAQVTLEAFVRELRRVQRAPPTAPAGRRRPGGR